jgi:predicted alpha/beta hydrolase
VVVFNCGAGIPASSYRRFSQYLAANETAVLNYDYRGIGRSRTGSLRGLKATIEDWAELDCSAAIEFVGIRCPSFIKVGLGHSIGSLLFGGAANASLISDFVLVSPHSGYVGDYRGRYRAPMAILWHGAMPALTRILGYFPARLLGLGEDIPAGVAMQWAKQVKPFDLDAGKRAHSPRMRSFLERCAELSGRALLVTFADDGFATEAATRRVARLLTGLQIDVWRIQPEEVGMRTIGHFGFFRREAETHLWPRVLEYLRKVGDGT